jgi:hypothetical protein
LATDSPIFPAELGATYCPVRSSASSFDIEATPADFVAVLAKLGPSFRETRTTLNELARIVGGV